MVLLNKCCFCAQLQTGGVILGWLGIISSVFSIIMSIFGLTFMEEVISTITANSETEPDQATRDKIAAIYVFLVASTVLLNIVILASSICLLTGAMKRKRLLLVPWLVCESIAIFFLAICLIGHFAAIFMVVDVTDQVFSFILTGVMLAIEIYLWLCVYSLFHQIREEEGSVFYGASTQRAEVKHDTKDGLPPYTTVA